MCGSGRGAEFSELVPDLSYLCRASVPRVVLEGEKLVGDTL